MIPVQCRYMRREILHVPVDGVTRVEAVDRIAGFLDGSGSHMVTTPNPEMLVAAASDSAFLRALQNADLAVPDGFGLIAVAKLLGTPLGERITGVDCLLDICRLAAEKHKSIFLLGGGEGVAKKTARVLEERFPGLRVVGAESGGIVDKKSAVPQIDTGAQARLIAVAPDVLFVAFGHSTQEKWIAAHLGRLPSVRVAIGVGGAFDFLSGRVRRAPRIMRALGLEWLWRLALEPRRIGRIWNAVVVFPYLALRRKG